MHFFIVVHSRVFNEHLLCTEPYISSGALEGKKTNAFQAFSVGDAAVNTAHINIASRP